LHPVDPDLPAEPPGTECRPLPVVFDEPDVVLARVDADGLERAEVLVEDVLRRRLEDDLKLVVVLEAVRVLAVAPVARADRRLDVDRPPWARAQTAKERRRVEGARPELRVVRLHQDAPALGPVGLERGDHVLVVQRQGARAYAESVLSRKPPWYSYEDAITAGASREARRPRLRPAASASGLRSSASIPSRPAGDSEIASARQFAQTAPPALGEEPTSPSCAPHSAQLVRCGRYPESQSSFSWKLRTSGSVAGRSRARGSASSSRSRKRLSASKARGFASCSGKSRSIASSPTKPTPRRYGSSRAALWARISSTPVAVCMSPRPP